MEYTRLPEKTQILIVDDEPSVRDVLGDFLNMEGYGVGMAEDGQNAMREMEKQHYDIVLSDMEMPGMGGLQLLRELSTWENPPLTIIMTGYGTVETAIDAMKSGAWDYLLKPFQIKQLAAVVERACNHLLVTAENIKLRAGQALYEVSEQLMNQQVNRIAYTRILANGCLRATSATSVRIWAPDDSGEWSGVLSQGDPELLAWIATDFFSSTHKMDVLRAFQEPRPMLIGPETGSRLFREQVPVADLSMVIAPIRSMDQLFGVMALATQGRGGFIEGDRRTVQLLASRLSAALHNHNLAESLRGNVLQTIEALISALEAKDDYTKGHSMRVAQWAVLIAEAMELDTGIVEQIRVAAILHDIGKIGINLNALNKPGKLTQEEYDNFKMHPVIGRDILASIDFLKPMLPMVLHHHERMDGMGYPLGLAGNEIPLGARIIGTADAFEVMVTDRVYRKALPLDTAREELRRNRGSQFDDAIVNALLQAIAGYEILDDLPVKGGRKTGDKEILPDAPYGSPVKG